MSSIQAHVQVVEAEMKALEEEVEGKEIIRYQYRSKYKPGNYMSLPSALLPIVVPSIIYSRKVRIEEKGGDVKEGLVYPSMSQLMRIMQGDVIELEVEREVEKKGKILKEKTYPIVVENVEAYLGCPLDGRVFKVKIDRVVLPFEENPRRYISPEYGRELLYLAISKELSGELMKHLIREHRVRKYYVPVGKEEVVIARRVSENSVILYPVEITVYGDPKTKERKVTGMYGVLEDLVFKEAPRYLEEPGKLKPEKLAEEMIYYYGRYRDGKKKRESIIASLIRYGQLIDRVYMETSEIRGKAYYIYTYRMSISIGLGESRNKNVKFKQLYRKPVGLGSLRLVNRKGQLSLQLTLPFDRPVRILLHHPVNELKTLYIAWRRGRLESSLYELVDMVRKEGGDTTPVYGIMELLDLFGDLPLEVRDVFIYNPEHEKEFLLTLLGVGKELKKYYNVTVSTKIPVVKVVKTGSQAQSRGEG